MGLVHTLADGDTEAELLGEHYINAGVVRVTRVERDDAEYGPGEVEVVLSGEAHVIIDWLINHWNGPSEAYPAGTHARLDLALTAMKELKPA